MRRLAIALATGLLATAMGAVSAEDNAALARMFKEDQSDRRACPEVAPCFLTFPADEARQANALKLLRAGQLRTASDFFHAALIFQHSTSADDNALAHALASVAARIDPRHPAAKWLAAAAWDRTLMRRNKPQWYGTQLTRSKDPGRWELHPVDESAVTDEERKAAGVPPLSESRERARKITD